MNRRRLAFLATGIVIVLIMCAFAVRHVVKRQAEGKRKVEYDAVLKGYSAALKPGMTRTEVEHHLRGHDIPFRQMCCVDVRRDAYADLVKIGQEEAPWYCSENNIYIAFEFVSVEKRVAAEAHPSDRLVSVRQYPWLEGCL